MRVPDLDWPADLFVDAAVEDERPSPGSPAILHADASSSPTALSLWLAMRRAWMSRKEATEMPAFAH